MTAVVHHTVRHKPTSVTCAVVTFSPSYFQALMRFPNENKAKLHSPSPPECASRLETLLHMICCEALREEKKTESRRKKKTKKPTINPGRGVGSADLFEESGCSESGGWWE